MLFAAALCLIGAERADAHDVSFSSSRLLAEGRQVTAVLTINALQLRGVDKNRDERVTYEELDERIEVLFAELKEHFRVLGPHPPVRTVLQKYEIREDHLLDLHLAYTFEQDVTSVDIVSTLDRWSRPDHRHLARVVIGGQTRDVVLDRSMPRVSVAAEQAQPFRTFIEFTRLGTEHIAIGFDHLAFILALVVGAGSLKSLVKVVTAFTVAHSITLAAATLDVVVPPVTWTESLIALSIAYVAVENLVRERVTERVLATFIFGLIHGFGFSSVLRDMQLPRPDLMVSLFSFNVGVEIGQVAFVCLLYPIVRAAARTNPRILATVSAAVMVVAVYWFVERAFLG